MINRRSFLGMLAALPAGVKSLLGLKPAATKPVGLAFSKDAFKLATVDLPFSPPLYSPAADAQRYLNYVQSSFAETIRMKPRMSLIDFHPPAFSMVIPMPRPVDRKRSLGRRRYLKRYRRIENA